MTLAIHYSILKDWNKSYSLWVVFLENHVPTLHWMACGYKKNIVACLFCVLWLVRFQLCFSLIVWNWFSITKFNHLQVLTFSVFSSGEFNFLKHAPCWGPIEKQISFHRDFNIWCAEQRKGPTPSLWLVNHDQSRASISWKLLHSKSDG